MKPLSRNAIIGYPAGIITGITYGLNPLFAMPLIKAGAQIESILFFRYAIAVVCLGLFLLWKREQKSIARSFALTLPQAAVLLVLGLLYTGSSAFLFEAYNYIPSGLATTLVFLYPILVALIMVFLRVVPSWPVWAAIIATFVGVVIMTQGDGSTAISPIGVLFSLASALVYALFIVIINRSKTIAPISNTLLTFYTLVVGTIVFATQIALSDIPLMTGLTAETSGVGLGGELQTSAETSAATLGGELQTSAETSAAGLSSFVIWACLIGLALLPTIISTASLAIASRNIGATKASVLGVFEPITAILVGTLAFGEPLTTNIILGIAIAIISITYMIAVTKR